MGDLKWADAWQQLVYEHSSFRAVDDHDFQDLLRQTSALEQLFLEDASLQPYYDELTNDGQAVASAAAIAGDDRTTHTAQTIHVAAMQLQLMEDAFYSLRLDRHANAPDNRGWMNLFRRWGRSPTFQKHVTQLEETFSRQFVEFYHHYIENWPADLPVPHPWDVRTRAVDSYAGATQEAVKRCMSWTATGRRGKGIFLDPGRVEAGPPRGIEEPMPVVDTQHGGAGIPPAAPPATPPATPPAAPDSSKTTD